MGELRFKDKGTRRQWILYAGTGKSKVVIDSGWVDKSDKAAFTSDVTKAIEKARGLPTS